MNLHKPIYICKKCNLEVGNPKRRFWRNYCESGHRLPDDATVRSFWESFVRTFMGTFFLLFSALSAVLVNLAEFTRGTEDGALAGFVGIGAGLALMIAILIGRSSLRQSKAWNERGGAVLKLVPRARGRAFGCLSAAGFVMLYSGSICAQAICARFGSW